MKKKIKVNCASHCFIDKLVQQSCSLSEISKSLFQLEITMCRSTCLMDIQVYLPANKRPYDDAMPN